MTPLMRAGSSHAIPSLDGLRAISILLVITFHLIGGERFNGAFAGLGNLGVRVFFVISGFLITGLLLKEMEKTGSINLKKFYVRRALRIFPAFYFLLATIGVCSAAGLVQLQRWDLIEAATYTINYFPGWSNSIYVRHIWSLAVEEQFYLLWPAVLLTAGRRRGMLIAASVLLLAPCLRLAYWLFLPSVRGLIDRRFETVADALATGCVLAGAQRSIASLCGYNRFLKSGFFFCVPAVVFLDNILLGSRPRLTYGIGITILNLGIALCIDRWTRYPDGVVGAILNFGPISTIGVLSYSIYLWQQPFLDADHVFSAVSLLISLLAVAMCSTGSFLFIEQPFQRLRARLVDRVLNVQSKLS